MNAEKRIILEKILAGMEKQKFFDWYNEDFENYIGDKPTPEGKEKMLSDLERLFHLWYYK